jgi:hypothetical protein
MTTTDEQLSTYLDGQLGTEAAYQQVETALSADPSTRARLDQLVWADERLRQALRDKYMEPVPAWLIARVWNTPWGPKPAVASPPAPKTEPPVWRRPWFAGGWALAATVATVAWVQLAQAPGLLQQPTGTWAQQGQTIQNPTVVTALNAVASGVTIQGPEGPLVVVGTVENTNGTHCREVAHGTAAGTTHHTWACRGNQGNWSVVATAAANTPAPSGTYAPAQGAASDPPFAAVQWLDAAQEQKLLQNQWHKTTPILEK